MAIISVVIFGILLIMSYFRVTQQVVDAAGTRINTDIHLSIILPNEGDAFFQDLSEGAQTEALRQETALEFLYYSSPGEEPGLLLRQARWIQTDGVLVFLPEENSFTQEITDLQTAGIPVITVINDNPLSGRTAHLGFDAEGIARELVRLMLDNAVPDQQRWGIFIAAEEPGRAAWQAERMDSVIRSLLAAHPQIQLLPARAVTPGYFAGEQETVRLLREESNVSGIIVAVPQTLSGVVYGLIDQHRLGDVAVAGMDMGTGVADAIRRNLLSGSIYRFPEQIGRSGVQALVQAVQGESVPEYQDLAYSAIDSRNISRFLGPGKASTPEGLDG